MVPVTLGSYKGWQNYTGYCAAEGRRLTDQEKIRIVVEQILAGYPKPGESIDRVRIENGVRKWESIPKHPAHPIPYRDINEFYSMNPDCCKVTKKFHDGDGWVVLPVLGRITGAYSDYVTVTYNLRYRDEQGNEQQKIIKTYPVITNCGETGNRF